MTEDDDTKFTKLFVGGIPYHTKDETMKEYFMQFDDIVEAVIIREKNSQRSKGYGFVSKTSFMWWSSVNAMIGIGARPEAREFQSLYCTWELRWASVWPQTKDVRTLH